MSEPKIKNKLRIINTNYVFQPDEGQNYPIFHRKRKEIESEKGTNNGKLKNEQLRQMWSIRED